MLFDLIKTANKLGIEFLVAIGTAATVGAMFLERMNVDYGLTTEDDLAEDQDNMG